MKNQKDYNDYKLSEVLKLSPDAFGELLSYESYNLVLVYRLLELKSYFLENEQYEYLVHVRNYFDEFSIEYDEDL
jgi:hypothetical protein